MELKDETAAIVAATLAAAIIPTRSDLYMNKPVGTCATQATELFDAILQELHRKHQHRTATEVVSDARGALTK
jgi:hypothetical protein